MIRILLPAGAALLLLVAGCQFVGPEESVAEDPALGGEDLVWVAKEHTGGRACVDRYQPPPPDAELARVGVRVVQRDIEHLPVCRACNVCPAYSALHYALIDASNLRPASRAGFERARPPSRP